MNIIINRIRPSNLPVYLRWVETISRDDLTKLASILMKTKGVEDVLLARYSGEIQLAEHVVTYSDFIPALDEALKQIGMTAIITTF